MSTGNSGNNSKPNCCTKNSPPSVDFVLPPPITSTAGMDPGVSSETASVARVAPASAASEVQSFSRMPSQRRRRLWTLAARAAARREHLSHEKESSSSGAPKTLGEISTQSSSFLKPGTVRTQDSGISSMDYVTSREANSPNSEETCSRQRASLSTTFEQSLPAPQFPGSATQTSGDLPMRPRCSTMATTRTKIVVSGEADDTEALPIGPMIRYTNLCNTYVPEWVRRNWSSAPRPLIARQRSSVETSYDMSADWAASMETLNMQYSLYPQHRRIFYGRYGRASCPKTTTFFDHPHPPMATIHMEEVDESEEAGCLPSTSTDDPAAAAAAACNLRRRRHESFPHQIPPQPIAPPHIPAPVQPCWCERPPPPHTHNCSSYRPPLTRQTGSSMLSPFFHCGGCPYRALPHYQYDLPQRHIRRRMLKRMSSEPTQPTWSSEIGEGDELGLELAPKRRAPPPPDPSQNFASPPPLPKRSSTPPPPLSHPQQQQQQPHVYAEPRIITATPKTDVFLRASEPWAPPRSQLRRPPLTRGGGMSGSLMRGRSVDEAYGSPRWDRQVSFISDPLGGSGYAARQRPITAAATPSAYIYEEGEVRDWAPFRRGIDSAPGRIGGMAYHHWGPAPSARIRKLFITMPYFMTYVFNPST